MMASEAGTKVCQACKQRKRMADLIQMNAGKPGSYWRCKPCYDKQVKRAEKLRAQGFTG